MAVSCEPSDLTTAAKCFSCMTQQQREAAKVYLLAVLAEVDPDPVAIMRGAACFMDIPVPQLIAMQNYLWCYKLNQ